jgi:regulator of protease activity HflC (stomatin/prohibitin superfamily)
MSDLVVYSAPTAEPPAPPPPPPRESWGRWLLHLPRTMARNARDTWREHKVLFIAIGFGLAFLVAYFWNDIVVKIRSGEAGVLYRLFHGGTVLHPVYGEGIWFVAPWNTMTVYNTRVQEAADVFTVLSKDGLEVKVSVSTRFNPQIKELGWLHQTYGPEYVEKIVRPEVQAEFRHVIGHYTPDQIYNSTGFIVQTVKQGVMAELTERRVNLDDVLIKSIHLPPSVAASIESKLRAQQMSLEMNYRITSEEKEADRKKIEAKGIRDFQDTITGGGISNEFLQFKGIEATLELAKSNNAKVIVIGGGSDRLPLIFDGTTPALAPIVPPAPTKQATPPARGPLPRR